MKEAPCIVVGVDFSEGSAAALSEARRLARTLACELRVVHVAEGALGGADWQPDAAARRWLGAADLDAGALVIRCGLAHLELTRAAEQLSPTLMVVGSHGASGFQPLSVGSTAQRLVILSPSPVLVVNPRTRAHALHGGPLPA